MLFSCEVRVSLKTEDTLPKQWTTFKNTKWYTIHILYPLKGMGIPHKWGRGGGGRRVTPEGETTPHHTLFTRQSYKGPITLTFSIIHEIVIRGIRGNFS